jgi:hypothetical protein
MDGPTLETWSFDAHAQQPVSRNPELAKHFFLQSSPQGQSNSRSNLGHRD